METDKDKIIKDLREELDRCFKDTSLIMEVNIKLRREIRMLEKLLELNMNDLHDIADQRDWYYEGYQKLKTTQIP
jgi:predicted transcriptional regulator